MTSPCLPMKAIARSIRTDREGSLRRSREEIRGLRTTVSTVLPVWSRKIPSHLLVCAPKKGANHGYGALVFNLGRSNCLWRLGCRQHDRCRLGLGAYGTTCRHSRINQPLSIGNLPGEADDPVIKNEMLELASVCDEVANNIEDHLTGG